MLLPALSAHLQVISPIGMASSFAEKKASESKKLGFSAQYEDSIFILCRTMVYLVT